MAEKKVLSVVMADELDQAELLQIWSIKESENFIFSV